MRPGYKECPFCAEEILEKAIKCRYCQSMLAPAPPTPDQPPLVRRENQQWEQIKKYLPPKVVESIREGADIAEEGERKQITVVFADLTGFTSLAERMHPEAVKLLMDECFQVMVECIERYDGTIDKYLGDAVMALFGAPVAHEDDPERAIRAAAEMRDAILRLGQSRRLHLELAIGVSTGEVVVGALGGRKYVEYTAIGDCVNQASRLEQLAEGGQIIINGSTYHCVRYAIECQSLGPLRLKGKREEVPAYVVSEVGDLTAHDARFRKPRLTPFVGRRKELAQLRRWLKESHAGQGRFVHLIGGAGVGKSRLLFELQKSKRSAGQSLWLMGRCLSFGESFPYHPLICLVKTLCEITPADNTEESREKIERMLAERFARYEEKKEILAHLLGLKPRVGSKILHYPPKERQELVFRCLLEIIRTMSRQRPLAIVFDDLQWADPSTLAFIDYALPRLLHNPVAVFLVYRPELKYQWVETVPYAYLRLQELPRKQSEVLLDKILDIPALPPKTRRELLAKSEGNPFYVEEMVQALIDFGVLQKKKGSLELVGDISTVPIPETVQGIILARIDRLSFQVKRIIQCASVIGYHFSYSLLEYMIQVQEQLKVYLTHLAGMELIYEKSALPELEYLFKHILTQEVAYGTLLTRRRREYHGRVAVCIEEIYHDRLEEHYELLAHHYSHSKDVAKAMDYCWKAGEKSRLLFANEAAIDFYSRRLERMPAEPEADNEMRGRIRTLLARGEVQQLTGKSDAAERDFAEAHGLAAQLGDKRICGDVALAQGDLARITGDSDNAVQYFTLAEEEYQQAGVSGGARQARCGLGAIHWTRGEYPSAQEIFSETLSVDDGSLGLWDMAHNWNNLGLVEWNLGNYDKAAEALQKSLEYRDELGDKKGSVAGLNNLGIVFQRLGDYEHARECYLKALPLAQEIEYSQGEAAARVNLGQLYALQGQNEAAQEHYTAALRLSQSSRDAHAEAMVLGNIGQVWCAMGKLDEAENWLKQARQRSEEIKDHDAMMNAEQGLAQLDLAHGDAGAARVRLEAALQIAMKRSHQDMVIPCRRLLATAHRELGELAPAKENAQWALEAARAGHHRAEEMWALYELAESKKVTAEDISQEIECARLIAQELGVKFPGSVG